MIDSYNISEISFEDFFLNYITQNKPCIIKGFFDETCSLSTFQKFVTEHQFEKYMIGTVPAYETKYKELCFNKFIQGITKHKDVYFIQINRLWKHNKGNITNWHYDGNGIDIFNACIQGSKDFYLSPPKSFPVYPLSNIAINIIDTEYYKVSLRPGDMLYIPAYWFHKVVTTNDNTININFSFYTTFNQSKIANGRDKQLITLHNIFNTQMCKRSPYVCWLGLNNNNVTIAIIRGFVETLPIIFLYITIASLLKWYTSPLHLPFNIIVLVALLVSIFYVPLQSATVGISRLIGVFTWLWMAVLIVL